MSRSYLPKSIRKFLRKEKSRLRRENLDMDEAENKIKDLVKKLFIKYDRNGKVANEEIESRK